MFRIVPFFISIAILLIVVGISEAQPTPPEEGCPVLVETIITETAEACQGLGRNEACYGHNQVVALDGDAEAIASFINTGDRVGLAEFVSLEAEPFTEEGEVWGVAIMSLQANLPDTLPGQNVTFVVFGDVSITDDTADGEPPLQAFQFSTGIGVPACKDVPRSGILVQSPTETTVNFTVNGVDVAIGSTALLREVDGDRLEIGTLEGAVMVGTGDDAVMIEPGFSSFVSDEGTVESATPYDFDTVWNAPLGLLPEPIPELITVPADFSWQNAHITPQPGQTITIEATGEVNLFTECEQQLADGDLPADTDCSLNIYTPDGRGEITQVDHDQFGYPFIGVPLGGLVARIGEGDPFYVGNSLTFTVPDDSAGRLEFFINDDPTPDNAGAYLVTVTVEE